MTLYISVVKYECVIDKNDNDYIVYFDFNLSLYIPKIS